jgi:signal transduction histidine kinase
MEIAASAAHPAEVDPRRSPAFLAASLMALAALSLTAGLIGLSSHSPHVELVATGRAAIVGVPIAVGLWAWWARVNERFGVLLIATGAIWFLASFAESRDDVLYTIGRTAGWFAEVLLVYLFLAFPDGRLAARRDRALVGLMSAVVAVAFLPRLVLANHFVVPSPYTSCTHDCPGNFLSALGHQPAFVDAVMKPAGAFLVVAVMVLVLVRLRERTRAASPVARRLLAPLIAVCVARTGLLAVGFLLREADADAVSVRIVSWSLALAVPLIALAFLLAVLRWRLFAGGALERLGDRLRVAPDAPSLWRALVEAFGDAKLELAFPRDDGDGWVDARGEPVPAPAADDEHSLAEIRDRGALAAVVVYDRALAADPGMLNAATGIAAVVLDNKRLAAEAASAADGIWRSRSRMVAGAERERKRIERDLHDGAQQRLVALRIELELAEEVVREDPEQGIARLQDLERGVDEALEEVRALAHGVYPPLLADQGLAAALRAAAQKSPVRVRVKAEAVRRYTPEIESAVYFCILEALQNVLKHAKGARNVSVSLDGRGRAELSFVVRDDGAGAPGGEIVAGAGLTNMHDRIAAAGGDLDLVTTAQVGTTVRGCVPTPV